MNFKRIISNFFDSEKAGGLVLIFVTAVSLFLANSSWQASYTGFWETDLGGHSIEHWINDGLMTLFFLLIGLELEREVYQGDLSDIKKASLPIFGALGGMFVPAGIFLLFNFGTATQAGAGIPMATDIAFAIGILSLLGNRVPTSLKVFLTALAVIDDLGAVIVIAIFYTKTITLLYLLIALAIFGFLLILNRLKINYLSLYIIGGVFMWYFMLESGVHATIAGVLLAFAIPFGDGSEKTVSFKVQHFLHKPVAFLVLPLFAMGNTCISIGSDWQAGLGQTNSIGIMAGLLLGKPLGIFLFSFIGTIIGLCSLPKELKWRHIIGVGFLGGIGFTMSIFVALLAFGDAKDLINGSKIAILLSSFTAGIIGFIWLRLTLKKQEEPTEKYEEIIAH